MNELAVRADHAVCVVKEQLVNHALVLYRQLRPHDVFLHLSTELLKSPAGIELNFKFDLFGAGTLGIDIRLLVRRVPLLQMSIFDFDGDEQLDALVVL